jgi:hypothetical protein
MRVKLFLDNFVLVLDKLVLEDSPVVVGMHHCGCMHGCLVEVVRGSEKDELTRADSASEENIVRGVGSLARSNRTFFGVG